MCPENKYLGPSKFQMERKCQFMEFLIIAQPEDLHYNHCASSSVRPWSVTENEPHGIF